MRWRAPLVLLLASALAGACTAPPRTCSKEQLDRIAEVAGGLRAANEGRATLDLDVTLPAVRGGGRDVRLGVLVALDRDGLRVAGQRPQGRWSESSLLEDALDRRRALDEASGAPAPAVIAAIAGDVPARDVAEFLALARRVGADELQVIAADADAPPIPAIPQPELAAELRARAAGDPARLPELLALALDDEIPRCPPLGEPIARLVPPTSATIAARTEEALRGCGCAADVDRVLTLLHLLIAPAAVTVVSRPLTLDPEGPGAITADADRPWSELAPAAFEAGRTNLWVVVR